MIMTIFTKITVNYDNQTPLLTLMKLKELTNIKILEKQDKNLNTYYLIFNQDSTQEAYFCFANTVKEG
jgi:hypothetical protein